MSSPIEDINSVFYVFGFDPPSVKNVGWCVFGVYDDKYAKLIEYGVYQIKNNEDSRLLELQDFVVDLFSKYYNVKYLCFERAIGQGREYIREKVGENTGVIKLVGISYKADIVGLHPSTVAKIWTGYGGTKKGEKLKTRVKKRSKEVFFPDLDYASILPDGLDFEHVADAIAICCAFLLSKEIAICGQNLTILPPKIYNKSLLLKEEL